MKTQSTERKTTAALVLETVNPARMKPEARRAFERLDRLERVHGWEAVAPIWRAIWDEAAAGQEENR